MTNDPRLELINAVAAVANAFHNPAARPDDLVAAVRHLIHVWDRHPRKAFESEAQQNGGN
jgi:hypothetical protein